MFQLKNTLVSSAIFQEDFVCNLQLCKGACCVEGDAGAPLEKEELLVIQKLYPVIKSTLPPKNREAIEQSGLYTEQKDKSYQMSLLENKACVFALFDKNNRAFCAFEQAYKKGLTTWQKPISCHLYPIRLQQYKRLVAVNYERWDICKPACDLGKKLQVPVYKFLKSALIRKFGKEWYEELVQIVELYLRDKKTKEKK